MTARFLTTAQMREADRRCIEDLGIPGAVLMHRAGLAVFNEIGQGPVGIVCGKGNNGGDGYVVAYLALLAGFSPTVILLGDAAGIRGDAAVFRTVFENLGGTIAAMTEPCEVEARVAALHDCAVLVDAMLGTGATGNVREPYRSAIRAWPAVRTVAVDVPSGLDADTGVADECCIRAAVTVTMQFAKCGFRNPAAAPYLGRVVVADIGIPEICADDAAWSER